MSVRAGSIVTVAGRNVVDRLQTAGLGNAAIPIETVRETGNDLVVDKVPGEADFTFSMESWDVSTDLMAFLTGAKGTQAVGDPPGAADPAGTEYRWENTRPVNITSPWKNDTGSQGGHIGAGLIIPNYYPTRLHYTFGVTAMAAQTLDLAGGSYYYAETPPVEEFAAGVANQVAFVTSEAARALRIGGAAGTTFQRIFGVMVDGVPMTRNVDYVESIVAADAGQSAVTMITFKVAPAAAADVRFCYFTEVAKALPQAVNADATVKPGAVRGRNIVIRVDPDNANVVLPGVQTFDFDATRAGTPDREMGNSEPTGRTDEGVDATGTVTIRPKDRAAFFTAMELVTGVSRNEVYGYFNEHTVPVQIDIQNPKNPATLLKSLFIEDGQFQPPGTPARVNTPTDFAFGFQSVTGTFSEFKGGRP